MARDKNIVEPIDASFEDVVDSIVQPAGGKPSKINKLGAKIALQAASPRQGVLDIGIQIQKDVNGIDIDVSSVRERVRMFVERGLMTGSATEGFQVTEEAARKFGFAHRESDSAATPAAAAESDKAEGE